MDSSAAVVDSWLSVAGQVLAFPAHVERFARSVERTGGDAAEAEAAIAAARSATPGVGDFFPRIEYTSARGFRHSIRAAPNRQSTAVLWTAPIDPRQHPTVKGPDLPELAGLRVIAAEHGANEAVVLDDGYVSEAAHSSIAWWRDDRLFYPDDALPRVDSVTWSVVRTLAASLGTDVIPSRATPHDLEGSEVWVMSALHGIRGVEQWLEGPSLAPPERRDLWQARLIALRERDGVR
ncbi:MAG TPA: aminotransferase class IV [Candidatus Agrococcus pullicola]|uniref:Aminotransferase class IV n=1 Tax=Candidatus Agrococcus pullicola TaxID=2838429 RepID=A0A9D1YXB4_9MICO|nr:aminotransferase class IV [Candidatus Agrococcus pullicola]